MGNGKRFIDAYGASTTEDDPNRFVWYSVNCTFWSDNISTLKTFSPGIPCCPKCGSPGYQTDAKQWEKGIEKYDTEVRSGYKVFIYSIKERCLGVSVKEAFLQYCAMKDDKKTIDEVIQKIIEVNSK